MTIYRLLRMKLTRGKQFSEKVSSNTDSRTNRKFLLNYSAQYESRYVYLEKIPQILVIVQKIYAYIHGRYD